MKKFALMILPIVVALLSVNCQTEQTKKPSTTSERKDQMLIWDTPKQAITNAEFLTNQTNPFELQRLKAFHPDLQKEPAATEFTVMAFWNPFSPMKKHTLKQLRILAKVSPTTVVVLLSENTPSIQALSSQENKNLLFYEVNKSDLETKIGLSSTPHLLVISPDNKVCWQGHPQHFDQQLLDTLSSKWQEFHKK